MYTYSGNRPSLLPLLHLLSSLQVYVISHRTAKGTKNNNKRLDKGTHTLITTILFILGMTEGDRKLPITTPKKTYTMQY